MRLAPIYSTATEYLLHRVKFFVARGIVLLSSIVYYVAFFGIPLAGLRPPEKSFSLGLNQSPANAKNNMAHSGAASNDWHNLLFAHSKSRSRAGSIAGSEPVRAH